MKVTLKNARCRFEGEVPVITVEKFTFELAKTPIKDLSTLAVKLTELGAKCLELAEADA